MKLKIQMEYENSVTPLEDQIYESWALKKRRGIN
jgi:hypothetical protein